MSSTLIIGAGNRYRQDDAVGLVVAERLRARTGTGCEVIEQSGDGAALMAAWKSAARVIVIDAVHSDGEPGNVFRWDARAGPLPHGPFHYSTHGFGLAEAIETARALGELPSQLIVYGIEGKSFGVGQELSVEVDRGAARAVELVWRELREKSEAGRLA